MNKIEVIIVSLFLWFYRIFGLTFGGIAFKANGKTYSNKFIIGFGLSLAVITTVYDLYQYVWNYGHNLQKSHQFESFINTTEKIRQLISIQRTINESIWFVFKSFALFYFNIRGYDFLEKTIDNYRSHGRQKGTRIKLMLVLLFWLTQLCMVPYIAIKDTQLSSIGIIWQIEFRSAFIYCWGFAITTNLASFIFAARLDQMAKELYDYSECKRSGIIMSR